MKVEDLTQDKLDELLAGLERVDALEKSNKGLQADLAKAKAKAKGAEIDPEQHAELQTQVEHLQSELQKATGSSKKEIEKLTAELSKKDGALNQYLIESNLTNELVKVGVKPEFMEATKALLKAQATIKADGDKYEAIIGDKPLSEAITEWASGDTGKHFIKAPDNNGGGSQGSGSAPAAKIMPRSEFDSKSAVQKMQFVKDGGKVTD
jgi:multidrug resistance efflux pump